MSENPKVDKEIYTYESKWKIYAMSWSMRKDIPFRFALGSYNEDSQNYVSIVKLNSNTGHIEKLHEFEHPYPPTKLMWKPGITAQGSDILASSSDYIRLYNVGQDNKASLVSVLSNKNHNEFSAPITSFDWNESNTDYIGTSSIDTTCTIWNVHTQQHVTQLIAHDKGVFDIAFAKGENLFASVGEDGSVRMFDLRHLDHSTILYETPDEKPLLRLAWNKKEPNMLATFTMDDNKVIILDIRKPSLPAFELQGHKASVNAISWAPHSPRHICTAGDDQQALIWELDQPTKKLTEPFLAYGANEEINQLQWSMSDPKWIGITYGSDMQILRV